VTAEFAATASAGSNRRQESFGFTTGGGSTRGKSGHHCIRGAAQVGEQQLQFQVAAQSRLKPRTSSAATRPSTYKLAWASPSSPVQAGPPIQRRAAQAQTEPVDVKCGL